MRLICFLTVFGLLALTFYAPAQAQSATTITGGSATLNVAPDKPEILRLDEEASSVIVGSPKYASVTLDSPTTLLIMPRAQGSTSLTVLNKRGEIIMERRLIVGGPQDDYVRIRRACTPSMQGCVPSQLYYCPDGCSDVSLGDEGSRPIGRQAAATVIPMTTPPPIPPIDASELEVEDEPPEALDKPQ